VRADGDVVWRPLNNPARLASSYFMETSPVRFGLHQRNRDFAAYQDANARYDLRPSLEVVPQGDWGRGFVRLVEIPTNMEIHDNIVAFFIPEEPVVAGDAREFSYQLRWGDLTTPADDLAQVVATSAGHGGTSGTEIDSDTRKFVVDFSGAVLETTDTLRPVVTVSGAEVLFYTLDPVPDAGLWRLVIDIRAERSAIVELTAHLATPERKVSEIWVAQWVVPDA
jgi:periplasmic glucans biosynthesis protein